MFDWVLNTPLRRDPVVYEILWSLTSLVNKDHTSTLTHTMLFPLKFKTNWNLQSCCYFNRFCFCWFIIVIFE